MSCSKGLLMSKEEAIVSQKNYNIPAQMLQKQSQEITAFYDDNPIKELKHFNLVTELKSFYYIQGEAK